MASSKATPHQQPDYEGLDATEHMQWQDQTQDQTNQVCPQNLEQEYRVMSEQIKKLTATATLNATLNANANANATRNYSVPPMNIEDTAISASATAFPAHGRESELTKELLRLIPRYDGNGGIQKLSEFTTNLENYVTRSNESIGDKLALASTKLTGDAKMWWLDHCNRTASYDDARIRTWQELCNKLKEIYAPPEQERATRNKLRNLKQRGTIADYTSEFRKLAMQISDFSDNEAKYAYLEGLQPKIQDLVISQKENFRDVRTLQAACLRNDNGIRNSSYSGGNNGNIEANMATSNNGQKFSKRPFGRNHGNHANSGNGGNNGNSNGGGNNAKNVKKLPKPRICAFCKGTGHYAKYCNKLKEFHESGKMPQAHYVNATTIIDSGATQHMFNDCNVFETLTQKDATITCANSQSISATHVGTVKLNDSKTLTNVLLVPELQHNLISVSAIAKEGNDVTFTHNGSVLINDATKDNPFKIGHIQGNLYHSETNLVSNKACIANCDDFTLWHHRFGHLSRKTLLSMPKYVNGIDRAKLTPIDERKCTACIQAKATRLPFGTANNRVSATLE